MLSGVLVFICIGLGVVVIRKLIDIRKSYVCPPETLIKEYFEGRLKKRDRRAYEKVITHIGVCEKCQAILEGYVTDDGTSGKDSNLGIEDHLIQKP